jgi:hypothetical protein
MNDSDKFWIDSEWWNNQTVSISTPPIGYGNITLTNSNLNNITLSDITIGKSHVEERIENLEKQLDKIINFINTFFDTDIKV